MTTHEKKAAEREAFEKWAMVVGRGFRMYSHMNEIELTAAWQAWQARSALTASEAAAQDHLRDDAKMIGQEAQEPGGSNLWQPIETAPEGDLVVVAWLDAEDADHPERYDFDWLEDGCWVQHHENHEHFVIAATTGSRGPSEKAPYTCWMPLPPISARRATPATGALQELADQAQELDMGYGPNACPTCGKSGGMQAPLSGAGERASCRVDYLRANFTPFYLLTNARRIVSAEFRRKQNWILAMNLFAVGSNSARAICQEAGIDPDATEVRAIEARSKAK